MESASTKNVTAGFEIGYRPALDGLRGVAILCVLGFHAGLPGFSEGSLGVDAFFVLSGFLITALLVREWQVSGTISLRRFYARRALRLFPAAGVALASIYVFSLSLPYSPNIAQLHRDLLATLFYVANWALAFEWMQPLGFLGHMWSLAIEEQFYFIWPPLLLLLLRSDRSRTFVVAAVAFAAAASGFWRAYLWQGPESLCRVFYGFDTRAEALLIGCLVGLIASWGGLKTIAKYSRLRSVAVFVAVAMFAGFVAFAQSSSAYMYKGGLSIVALAVACVIVEVLVAPNGRIAGALSAAPLVAIGKISYGVYLWHWPVFVFVSVYRLDWPLAATAALQISISFLIASVSYVLVERPFLRLKSRFAAVAVEPRVV